MILRQDVLVSLFFLHNFNIGNFCHYKIETMHGQQWLFSNFKKQFLRFLSVSDFGDFYISAIIFGNLIGSKPCTAFHDNLVKEKRKQRFLDILSARANLHIRF